MNEAKAVMVRAIIREEEFAHTTKAPFNGVLPPEPTSPQRVLSLIGTMIMLCKKGEVNYHEIIIL